MLSLKLRRLAPLLARNLTLAPPILNQKKYLPNEEWIYQNNNEIKFGITKEASEQMGEIVFMEFLFNEGDFISKDDEIAVIESVKSVQVLNAPFDCIVLENNSKLEDCLENLNENPECEDNSWLMKLEEQKD
jgi:glycine cleavage system H protein